MNKKRVCGLLAVIGVSGIIIAVGRASQQSKSAYVYDSEEHLIGTISLKKGELEYESELKEQSYIDNACVEAVHLIEQQENLSEKEAKEYLVKHELKIHTYFKNDIYESIASAYMNDDKLAIEDFGAVLTDDHGHMLASYSASEMNQNENFILNKKYAGSSMKPISIYGPAIEDGIINWSTEIVDEPYKKLKNAEGEEIEWPQNTKDYTYQNTTIEEAMAKSLNTIAVKTLKLYGVEKACRFLEDNFQMQLSREKALMEQDGEDEILGAIALGYLKEGVSVKDIAGFYQVFANGGTYSEPRAIVEIEDKDGSLYIQPEVEERRVFSMETAYIVNRLLKNVVSPEGTAADAYIEGVDLCGKTGTSDDFEDNWFTGIVPGYVMSVWYGNEMKEPYRDKNEAVTVVHDTFEQMSSVQNKIFKEPDGVIECEYCEKTGLLAIDKCCKIRNGFYNKKSIPKTCTCQ